MPLPDPHRLFDLSGKTALVTGGATGIGRMASDALAAAGARVLLASRKADACEAAAREINAALQTPRAEGFAGDVASEDGVAALAAAVRERTDALHILVNNAGRSWGAPLETFPYKAWDTVLSLNVTGLFALTQSLAPLLEAAASDDDPARVVNLGSVMGEIAMGERVYSYAASKAAVHHLTRVLAKEWAARRITVNALAPGPFESRMTAFATADPAMAQKVAATVPLGRLGRADDIAGALLYLTGRGGAYLTGAILPLSGGVNVTTGPPLFEEAYS